MKTMRVGTWYAKLTPKEQAYFCAKVERFGVQRLRSFFTTARNTFTFQSEYEFGNALTVIYKGVIYHFSYDRKEFFKGGE